MRILFVCKHNRFRSKVAEAFFNYYDNGNNEIKTRGVHLDELRPFVADIVKKVLKEKGIFVKDETPRLIDDKAIKWADKIIIVADNVVLDGFPREKVEVWKIRDAHEADVRDVRRAIEQIEKMVRKLVEELQRGTN